MVSVPTKTMMPGDLEVSVVDPGVVFRLDRIVARAIAHPPDIRHYHKRKRPGGSRRKGRRASWDWGAACLRHRAGRWVEDVRLVGLDVGGVGQITFGEAPIQLFGPEQFGGALSVQPGPVLRISVRNADDRAVSLAMMLFVTAAAR